METWQSYLAFAGIMLIAAIAAFFLTAASEIDVCPDNSQDKIIITNEEGRYVCTIGIDCKIENMHSKVKCDYVGFDGNCSFIEEEGLVGSK